jgi:hypothetical protein
MVGLLSSEQKRKPTKENRFGPHKKLTTYPRETSWWPGTAVVRADDAGARKNPYGAELFRACVLSSATSC